MTKKTRLEFDPETQSFCKKHKKIYDKELDKEAGEYVKKCLAKKSFPLLTSGCPECKEEVKKSLFRSLVTPEESAQHRMLSGPRIRLPSKGKFISTTKRGWKK